MFQIVRKINFQLPFRNTSGIICFILFDQIRNCNVLCFNFNNKYFINISTCIDNFFTFLNWLLSRDISKIHLEKYTLSKTNQNKFLKSILKFFLNAQKGCQSKYLCSFACFFFFFLNFKRIFLSQES